MIKIKDVSKVFKRKGEQDLVAVNDVTCTISKGEIFGVIGYSGAGKSTLIRLLNGLEVPTSGSIEVDSKDLGKLSGKELRSLRAEIGMIFQHFNLLWSRTVRENIAFPLEITGMNKTEREKRVAELIRLVGLEGKGDFYPSQLSGGQKQRVGIARALANHPKVLLCDEATSALDPETTDSILQLLVEINKELGLTIVLITHEMHVIEKICNKVAVMEAGSIVEVGHVLEVFKNPKSEVTRKFVQQLSHPKNEKETTTNVLEKYPSGRVVHLTFIGESAETPVLSKVIRDFEVDVNIIQGKITQNVEGPIGTLTVHMDGKDRNLDKAIQYLNDEGIGVEVEQNV